ncbi:hypothetical protein [Nocardioides bruguierae]|uniref:Uncharacterized protein n=1 Tax=Nocardioides bruguierae TaxID=2945102 RepID=A0A9X2D4F4_9ACTN|nr:hypothetical protein [Nocardioides bruguierae]MCM0619123.1 hypothetical protein [Nocardioides bruguierae]
MLFVPAPHLTALLLAQVALGVPATTSVPVPEEREVLERGCFITQAHWPSEVPPPTCTSSVH